jgi:cytochrome c-type biogenesis protein
MVQQQIGLVAAFVAGVASFISPCVLPLVPAYLSFMSGVSLADLRGAEHRTRHLRSVFLSSLAFVLGFSLVFVALGASASAIGKQLLAATPVIGRVAGVLIVILGVHMTGLVRIPFLEYERRFQASGGAGLATSFVMGLAFAFGWTPCIGPILAVILAQAASAETVGRGILLLAVYSAGLGLPFLLAGLFLNAFYAFFSRMQRHFHLVEVVAGCILIGVGLLLVFNQFGRLAYWFAKVLPTGTLG